ncbi:MAG: MBL fold metallo-hydrolase [Candidatus Omnitrophica bacterium]|nr:MBL fold metallo-hydrolase [Candidatus Omnitrophota bacterium]MCM8830917.1 MBL fold metallo-hydrolase [Candidatus Omnitrophota bacterium]
MDGLKLYNFVLGKLQTNCYIIYNKFTKVAFLVDAPTEIEEVKNFINKNGLNLLFILITHAHFDHIAGLGVLDYKFYIHEKDYPLLKNHLLNGSSLFGEPISIKKEPIFYKGDVLEFDKFIVEILHTPGHTPGSVCLKLGNWLFTGDTIFFDSIGRTDIPLAEEKLLLKSIRKILTLDDDIIIYPGHGISTTLERERKYNPYISSLSAI